MASSGELAIADDGGRWRGLAAGILAIAVVATVLGTVVAVLRGDGSSINAFLFLDLGLSHEHAALVERITLGVVSVATIVAVAFPRWYLLVPVAAYMLLEAVAGSYVRGYAFSELTPAAHALRYLAPLAWVLLVSSVAQSRQNPTAATPARPPSPSPAVASANVAAWLLRLGLALVFLAHGYEALQLHPEFIDLVISSGIHLAGTRIDEATASTALRVIGAVDIVAALLLLVRPWRPLLVWLAFWGLVTAASRVTSYGWGAHTDVLLRFTHFAAPVALLLIVTKSPSRRTATSESSSDG